MRNGMSDFATQARELIATAGGPMKPGQKLKGYFWSLSVQTGLSVRTIRAAWAGQQLSRRTADVLREAQGRHEAEQLAVRLETLAHSLSKTDADFHRTEIDALIRAVRALRGLDRPRTDGDLRNER